MITQSALYSTSVNLSKSLERLSTGLRINSASDDAAGLGVSENLRTQVNGTAQANRNAQDGIAALNIAEGAANEVSSMLQRMRELAVQSSNDTLTSTERSYTHQEFDALRSEINRISSVTNYNKQELISSTAGRFGSGTTNNLWIDANTTQGVDNITISIGTLDVPTLDANLATRDITTQAHAVNAISEVDAALNSVNSVRAISAHISTGSNTPSITSTCPIPISRRPNRRSGTWILRRKRRNTRRTRS